MTVKLMLAEIRTQRGMTQEELALAMNMSLGGIQYLEYKAAAVKFVLLDQLCEVLDCGPGDLIQRFNDQTQEKKLIARKKDRQQRSERMRQWWASKRQQSKHKEEDAA